MPETLDLVRSSGVMGFDRNKLVPVVALSEFVPCSKAGECLSQIVEHLCTASGIRSGKDRDNVFLGPN